MRPVPNIPLLWVAGLVVIPACTAVFFSDGVGKILGLLALIFVLLFSVADLVLSRRFLQHIHCSVPELVRATKGKDISLTVEFSNTGIDLESMRYGMAVARDFRIDGEVIGKIREFQAQTSRKVEYPIVPLRRGRFFLETINVETVSRFRLWLMRRSFSVHCEVRVYPDLTMERKRLSSLFLMRGNEGTHVVRQVGKGRDFEQLREYQPGDDYIDIDWKATARRQMPVTRTYQIEKTQEVYVVLDHSRLSAREIRVPYAEANEGDWLYRDSTSGGDYFVTTQLEKFLHCSLVLSSVAERQGDLFGFLSFADKVDRFIRGRNGKQHYNIVRDALYTLEPSPVAPDFEELMIALRQRLTRRALIVMLVDLSDPLTAEHFYDALPLINRQHLVLVNMVRPEKAHPLFSARSMPENISSVYENLGGHFQWQALREMGNRLRHLGVELGIPDHEELCTDTVTQYLNIKKRQLI